MLASLDAALWIVTDWLPLAALRHSACRADISLPASAGPHAGCCPLTCAVVTGAAPGAAWSLAG
eukprot:15444774-Alexandrium_andersonii.AAC.1